MLFNSFTFIFLFLPLMYGVYLLLERKSATLALFWLSIGSVAFYGWERPGYLLPIILGSILVNFFCAEAISICRLRGHAKLAKSLLWLGIALNLASIAYYKYAGFFLGVIDSIAGLSWTLGDILLPLGISFFTFQQITYLVDVYHKQSAERNFVKYTLFVTFFPQLIAGPIVHHKEMLPQFEKGRDPSTRWDDLAVGLSIFVIGLFKKVCFADNVKLLGDVYFSAADNGTTLTFWEAWVGTASYTLQIYFDFSGYSDMAIGLARMFGILLPLNFASPYKSRSISEFWRTWHMTLSRFLRDYLYIPLGGSRCAPSRRYANLLITMLIGGLWHGAGWNFIVWGGLHGLYLIVNHFWIGFTKNRSRLRDSILCDYIGWAVTLFAVMVAWVFFRATTFDGATDMLKSMFGMHGIALPAGVHSTLANIPVVGALFTEGEIHQSLTFGVTGGCLWVIGLFVIALWCPNTQQIMRLHRPALDCTGTEDAGQSIFRPTWALKGGYAVLLAILFTAALLGISGRNAFLYFQF